MIKIGYKTTYQDSRSFKIYLRLMKNRLQWFRTERHSRKYLKNIINLNFIVRLQFNSKYDTTSKDLQVQNTVSYSSLHSIFSTVDGVRVLSVIHSELSRIASELIVIFLPLQVQVTIDWSYIKGFATWLMTYDSSHTFRIANLVLLNSCWVITDSRSLITNNGT
jgi:hypothetical protein